MAAAGVCARCTLAILLEASTRDVASSFYSPFKMHWLGPMFIWVWLKINQEGLRRFWSVFPLTRVPFWHRLFEPQTVGVCKLAEVLTAIGLDL